MLYVETAVRIGIWIAAVEDAVSVEIIGLLDGKPVGYQWPL